MKKLSFLAATTLALGMTATPALADDAATLAALQAQLKALSEQVQNLSAKVEAQNTTIAEQKAALDARPAFAATPVAAPAGSAQAWDASAVASAPPVVSSGKTPVKVSMGQRLKIESADGLYSFEPFGRLHYDVAMFHEDNVARGNNTSLRRAHLGFRGKLGEDFGYSMEVDFGNENTNLRDAFISYSGLDLADLYFGNLKPAFGFEQTTSSNDLMMIDSAAVSNALARSYLLGALASAGDKNWSFRTGVFNEDASVHGSDDEGVSFEARATTDLLRDSDNVLHVGAGASWRKPNSATKSMTFASSLAGSASPAIVSTGAIANVDSALVYNAELGAGFGPWSLQAEYMAAEVDRDGAPSPRFDGWYAQTGWILTGESRPYNGKIGAFGRVKPKSPFNPKEGTWGAVEVLARYDTLSLDDAGITGGEVDQYGLGVNWYLRDNIRMMLNYTKADADRTAPALDDAPEVYQLRAQVDF